MDRPQTPTRPSWLQEQRAEPRNRAGVWLSEDELVEFPVEIDINGRRGYVSAEMLGISDALARDLEAFQQWWERLPYTEDEDEDEEGQTEVEDPDWARWRDEGWRLVERLRAEIGPGCQVGWSGHESTDGASS